MTNKVFQIVDSAGATYNGNDLTTSVATIEPGLLVKKDAGASTVSLAGSSGSAPYGVAFGARDLPYAPTTRLYDTGEALVVVSGHGIGLWSADFFSSGSVPTDQAANQDIYAGSNGLLALTGTYKIGRLIDIKTVKDASGGTGTSNNLARIEFNFVP